MASGYNNVSLPPMEVRKRRAIGWSAAVLAFLAGWGPLADGQEALRREPHVKGPTANERRAREHHEQGRKLMRSEGMKQAVEELREAVRLDPDLIWAHYDLGQAYMSLRDYPAAVNSYVDCRDAWRRFVDALEKGDFDADVRREDRLTELRDRLRELSVVRPAPGTSLYAQVEMEKARVENLIQALYVTRSGGPKRYEIPAELSLALGSAYFRSGQLEEAQREYQAAVTAQPRLGEAHNNLAVVYLLLGRPADAKAALERAEKTGLRISPELKKDVEIALARASN